MNKPGQESVGRREGEKDISVGQGAGEVAVEEEGEPGEQAVEGREEAPKEKGEAVEGQADTACGQRLLGSRKKLQKRKCRDP